MQKTTIRTARIEDLPRCETFAREFYAASQFLNKLDMSRFVSNWTQWLESGIGVMFLAEENGEIIGGLGGVKHPEPYSGELIASEFFWFVRQAHRGAGLRLYKAFESWAREQGCSYIRMVHLLDSMPEKLNRVYERLGFQPVEVHFQKEIK
jgi:GNAT superfamily N-acetyltransferase